MVNNSIVSAFAGTGANTSTGDGFSALLATLYNPDGLTVAPDGSLYITEYSGYRVRLVTPDGTVTTVAGTGAATSSGDFGPASAATLNQPRRVVASPVGDLFISEGLGCRIRRVDAVSGLIFTMVGNGVCARSGDSGPASLAQMGHGYGLAFDSEGILHFSEFSVVCGIRKIDASGIVSTTVGSSGSCTTSGDGGPAVQAGINNPLSIVFDAADNLYVVEMV